jgi:leucyl-tRNA synthetase
MRSSKQYFPDYLNGFCLNFFSQRCSEYLMEAAHSFRLTLKNTLQVKAKGGKTTAVQTIKPTSAVVWVAKTFPPWQSCVLDTMRELFEVIPT